MRAKILIVLLLFIGQQAYSQTITVDDTMTPEELVVNVLFQDVCGNEPTNIMMTNHSGADNLAGETNGANQGFESYGYFSTGTAAFPFTEGIILSSSNVTAIPDNGAAFMSFGSNAWEGDPNLVALAGGGQTFNATAIEFEFVPISDQISFRYILASEEYTTSSNYPCSFADTFAFILSGPGIADSNLYDHDANPATPELNIDLGGRNIALLPNSNIPASITNIHTFTCGAGLGQFAFPEYYDTPGSNNGSTAFDGQTIPLKAEATVIPGETYTIKLVISDYTDNSFDSAVFLEGGSFDIGAFDLGQDRLLTTGNPICEGEAITLDATSPIDTATYQWSRDAVELVGETNPTLDVTTSGTYSVVVSVSTCDTQDSIVIEFAPVPVANEPNNLLECAAAGVTNVEFDLSLVDNDVLLTQDPALFDISYHLSQADADAGTNPLPTLYTNGTNPETIFVRIEDLSGMCFDTTSFDLEIYEQAVANTVANIIVCDDDSNDNEANFTLTDYDIQVLGTQDAALFTITYHESMDDAVNGVSSLDPAFTNTSNPQTIYVRIENNDNVLCNDVTQFDIQINTQPIANQPLNMAACDTDGNLVEDFDFTMQEATILDTQDPADFNITFHENMPDAEADANPLATTHTGSDGETIFVRIDSTEAGNDCYAITSFTLSVNPLPIPVLPTTLEECDDDTDGLVGFTLTDADAEILAGQTSTDAMTITYYETIGEAQTGVGTPLVSPYTNTIAGGEAVFIRIENTVTGCVNTSMVNVQVNPAVIATTPANYSVCDDTNGNDTDGLGTFDLSTLDAEILGGLAGTATVTYYTTDPLAQAGAAGTELPTMFTTGTAGVQIIHARVTDNITGCFDVVEVTLITNPLPNLDNIAPLIACDIDMPGDMMEMFDLTTHTTTVENGQVGLTITYHESEADADGNTGAITNLIGTHEQLIWVRAVNLLGCIQVGSFELQVQPLPLIAVPTTLEACDDETSDGIAAIDLSVKNDEITLSNPDLNVSYHLTAAEAEGDVGALVMPYDNTATPTTYTVFVRVEDINTGCHIVTQLTVNINDTPAVFPATPLEYCDTDNDGIGIFDLTDAESEITGGVLPGQVTVTYHETPEDADNDVNNIANSTAYGNINPYNQTIYVRVENVLTGCFNVVPLALIVHDSPEIAAIDATSLSECDDITADQIAQFDLTEAEVDILNGEDPATHTVRYYNTQANAIAGTTVGEINNTNAYSNIPPSPQVIWVRVEDGATGCASITNLTLIVDALPVLVQLPGLDLCDAITLDDQIEVFDLTSLAEDLVNNVPGISLVYYANAADLASDTPIMNPSAYPNAVVAVQTIFVLATNDTTGCQNTITFDIRVNPLPSPTLDPNGTLVSETCDDDNDGFAEIDIDALVADIINNEPDVVYSFHETEAEAIANLNALTSPYTNIVMDSQTIYVLATNTVTGCFTVTPLVLTVIPIPEIPINITDLEECDDAANLDGFTMFDLTETQTEIYGTQTPGDFTLTYHESEQDAIDDVSPIVNLTDYINITVNQQTIWVRLEHNTTECFAIESFDIIVVPPPVLVQPTAFSLCDDLESGDESDEISTFDLTEKYIEITGGDTSLTLTYYASEADLNAGSPIADPTAYQNISNPQVLYIRAANAAGCTTDITMTLRVLPIPTPNTTPTLLEACDDDTDGDATNGILIFDLTQSEAEIVDNESNVTVSYHTTQEDADADTNPIADPTMHSVDMATADANGQVIIYVRVESDIQIDSNMLPCYKVVELPVVVHPLPELTATAFTYVFCEYDADNVGQFQWDDVTNSLDLLTAPQMVADFTVTYHLTVAEALAGTGALVDGFENTTDPQTIFIRVENTATGCVNTNNIASLEISVEPIPTATAPDTFQLCAVDEADQDTAVFDLTTLDATIINGQLNMVVSYYETATDADGDINMIANATSYTNTSNPQTLYARVRQTITGCLSDPILVNLQVNPLPVFSLPADDILCVDADTGLAQNQLMIGVDLGAGFTYLWNTPDGIMTTPTVTVTMAGTYSLVITDANFPTNCSFSDSVMYEASSPPASLDVQITTPAFADTHNVIATATGGSGVYEYQLDDGEWQETGEFLDLQPGEHTVTVRDTNGCGELVRTFELIDYMKFFTPNGDEFHPTWNIIGLRNQPSAKIYIFDRYGKLLKQISPAGIGWDGTFNGSPMPSQDYWFRVEYVDPFDGSPKEFINHFTLKR